MMHEIMSNTKPNEGFVITAGFQTAGKGQYGNRWESEARQNILFTVLLKPDFLELNESFLFNKAITIAVQQTIAHYIQTNVYIKWPNDILINRKKASGILIENVIYGDRIRESIIGIGINVLQKTFNTNLAATSMYNELPKSYHVEKIIDTLVIQLDKYYHILKNGNHALIKSLYDKYLLDKDKNSKFLINGIEHSGIILSVNNQGLLEVKWDEDSIKLYPHKSIYQVI